MAENKTREELAGRRGLLSLIPLAFFLLAYLGGSAVLGDFYKIPMTVAFLASSVLAVAVSRGSLTRRIERFSAGAGNKNILLMVWIYILAGAFAYTAKEIGAVDATVGLILRALPSSMVYVALFLAAAFVSMAIGTSVGTIVALVPIAAGMAEQMGQSPAELAALVVGAAYFGDNLSFISDTTVAATQTQGVRMDDKFKMNVRIVWPAVAIMLVYSIVMGLGCEVEPYAGEVRFSYILPYAVVIGLAIWGINVMAVLLVGIVATGVVGIIGGDIDFWGYLGNLGAGVTSMGDLIVVAMLAGGMLELIRVNGGLDVIMNWMQKGIRGRRGAQASIGILVALADLCTANNTVAIITVSRIAKDISDKFGVDPRRTASILDTVSCCVQGMLPYGVQMLLAANLAGCTPLDIVPHLYYPLLMGVCVAVSIVLDKNKKPSSSESI